MGEPDASSPSIHERKHFVVLLSAIFLYLAGDAILALVDVRDLLVGKITAGLLLVLLVGAASAAIRTRSLRARILGFSLGLLAVVAIIYHTIEGRSGTIPEGSQPSFLVMNLALALLAGHAVIVILHIVFESRRADLNMIAAALCVYMLLALFWAFLYPAVEYLQPDSFKGVGTMGEVRWGIQTIYFSFVTLTTLGFGDITPTREAAQLLVLLEAVTGQLYTVVIVARLVGLNVAQWQPDDD